MYYFIIKIAANQDLFSDVITLVHRIQWETKEHMNLFVKC